MIETERLRLRPWREEDREPFCRLLNTPAVREHLGGVADRAFHDEFVDQQMAVQAEHGQSCWAMEERDSGAFLGFCGIGVERTDAAPLVGQPELGWRLREDCWGRGYAREAAEASIAWGRAHLPGRVLHAKTVERNVRSWGLMERLGMARRPEFDFDHPLFEPGHPLRAHIVYVVPEPAR